MKKYEKFIEIKGRKLWVKQLYQGPTDELGTIVFLHDALGSVAQWKEFPEIISKRTGFNVLLYDRYGHGRSDPEPIPPDETFLDREALVVLPEVLHQMEVDYPILYGHSDGGTIAMIYAAHIQTQALILEAAHIMTEKITRKGVRNTVAKKETLLPKLKKYHGEKTSDLFDYWSGIWSGDLMKEWNIEHILSRIDAPTLILQGMEDNYGSKEQVNRIAQGINGKKTTIMIENCGHSPHKEYPEEFANYMAEFLNELE